MISVFCPRSCGTALRLRSQLFNALLPSRSNAPRLLCREVVEDTKTLRVRELTSQRWPIDHPLFNSVLVLPRQQRLAEAHCATAMNTTTATSTGLTLNAVET